MTDRISYDCSKPIDPAFCASIEPLSVCIRRASRDRPDLPVRGFHFREHGVFVEGNHCGNVLTVILGPPDVTVYGEERYVPGRHWDYIATILVPWWARALDRHDAEDVAEQEKARAERVGKTVAAIDAWTESRERSISNHLTSNEPKRLAR